MSFGAFPPEEYFKNDPKLKPEDVKIFQEWLEKQPHMPKLEECQLLPFLRKCNYSIEAAKVRIDTYFTKRTLHPDLFFCPTEDVLRRSLSVAATLVIPMKNSQGCHIFLIRIIDSKPENYNFVIIALVTDMLRSLCIYQTGCLGGAIIVFDFKGSTLAHLAKINLIAVKRHLVHLQKGVPLKVREIHYVNAVPFMDKVLAMIKPFMTSKLFNKIQIHSSFDTLYNFIPKECLPADYGGDLPTIQMLNEDSVKKVVDNLDFFKWHDSQKTDESKRMEKSKLGGETFGVDGTFKRLCID